RADRMRAETIPDIKKSPGGLLRPGSLERLARKSLFGKRLHQFGTIEQLRQLGDRLLGRSMFAGDVTGDDRLRLEDRIDEDVVAHDLLVPHGVDCLGRGDGAALCKATLIRRSLNGGLTRSVIGGARRGVTETEIEAGAHDALGLFDIDECRAQPGDLRREGNLAGAEIVIAIFDEAGEKVGEGIFPADADGPSRARLARRISGPEDDRGRPVVVALPGAATPDVAEEATPGVADAAGHARQRADPAVICDADLARAVVAAFGVRPGIVALDGQIDSRNRPGRRQPSYAHRVGGATGRKNRRRACARSSLSAWPIDRPHGRRGSSRSSSKPGRPAAAPYRREGACLPHSLGSPAKSARPLRTGISASPRPPR